MFSNVSCSPAGDGVPAGGLRSLFDVEPSAAVNGVVTAQLSRRSSPSKQLLVVPATWVAAGVPTGWLREPVQFVQRSPSTLLHLRPPTGCGRVELSPSTLVYVDPTTLRAGDVCVACMAGVRLLWYAVTVGRFGTNFAVYDAVVALVERPPLNVSSPTARHRSASRVTAVERGALFAADVDLSPSGVELALFLDTAACRLRTGFDTARHRFDSRPSGALVSAGFLLSSPPAGLLPPWVALLVQVPLVALTNTLLSAMSTTSPAKVQVCAQRVLYEHMFSAGPVEVAAAAAAAGLLCVNSSELMLSVLTKMAAEQFVADATAAACVLLKSPLSVVLVETGSNVMVSTTPFGDAPAWFADMSVTLVGVNRAVVVGPQQMVEAFVSATATELESPVSSVILLTRDFGCGDEVWLRTTQVEVDAAVAVSAAAPRFEDWSQMCVALMSPPS